MMHRYECRSRHCWYLCTIRDACMATLTVRGFFTLIFFLAIVTLILEFFAPLIKNGLREACERATTSATAEEARQKKLDERMRLARQRQMESMQNSRSSMRKSKKKS